MNYEQRVVCFLDILGFMNLVDRTLTSDGKEDPDRIGALAGALSHVRDVLDIDNPQYLEDTVVTQFSDSIVISFPSNTKGGVFHALLSILFVQIGLVHRGLLCRGAVVQGPLIHTDKLLFGPALVTAYTLEKKAALYPRVIVDDALLMVAASAHGHHHLPQHELESVNSMLKRDGDGLLYVDYLGAASHEFSEPEHYPDYLERVRSIVEAGLKSKDPSVVVKYGWLRTKLQPHLEAIAGAEPYESEE